MLVALAWIARFAAGVARRRIRLSTDQPMGTVWDTIGAAGSPPKDGSYNFAAYAIALTVRAWIVIPLAPGCSSAAPTSRARRTSPCRASIASFA